MFVCQTITFESLDVGSLYLHIRCISTEYVQVKIVFEAHRVKVKVTGADIHSRVPCDFSLWRIEWCDHQLVMWPEVAIRGWSA